MAINGTLAVDTNNFPQIDVQYKWKICNYDVNFPVKLLNGKDDKKNSYFKVWNKDTTPEQPLLSHLYGSSTTPLKPFNESGSGSDENCISLTENHTIDTESPDWFVSAQFEGHPYDGENRLEGTEKLTYCYAYAFTPIRIEYEPCNMSVSTK